MIYSFSPASDKTQVILIERSEPLPGAPGGAITVEKRPGCIRFTERFPED